MAFGKDQTDKPLARLIKRKREREDTPAQSQEWKWDNNKEFTDIKSLGEKYYGNIMHIIWQLMRWKRIFERQVLPNLTEEELNNMTSVLSIKDTEFVIETFPTINPSNSESSRWLYWQILPYICWLQTWELPRWNMKVASHT